MRLGRLIGAFLMAGCGIAAGPASAQFEPPTVQRGPKLPPVTVFPPAGTYQNTTGVALIAADGAEIHYTLDGSKPTDKSQKVEAGQVIFVAGLYDGDHGLKTGYTIRAVATQADHTDSDPQTFTYMIERRDRTAYISEIVAPGVRMIRDSDNDKMFLVEGTKAFALIDTGMGRGALRDYVAQFTHGLPLTVIFTHSHGDHIGQGAQFITGSTAYVGSADRKAVAQFLERQGATPAAIEANLRAADGATRIDLGDRQLEIVAVPGHTPGSIAIFDPSNGNLFSGDTFGNNSSLPPDAMWMQGYQQSLDIYLANERLGRERLAGRVKRIFTGHNDRPLEANAYLDNLERAIQRGLDQGEAALIPSWRPAGIYQLVEGDRFKDPAWFGVNINRATFMPAAPDQVAGLTVLRLDGGSITPRFSPDVYAYTAIRSGKDPTMVAVPTSTRSRALRINGRTVTAGKAVRIGRRNEVKVEVVAPDGTTSKTYRVRFQPAASRAPRR